MPARPLTTDRRERLLEAGLEAFGRLSYEQVSTERVAERAGVAQGLLFHYFGTKRKFYVEVNRLALAQIRAGFEANPDAEPHRWIVQEIETFLFGMLERPPKSIGAGIDLLAEVSELVDEQQEWGIRRVLDRMGIEEPTPFLRVALRGWMGCLMSGAMVWLSTPEVSRVKVRDLFVDDLNATLAHVAAVEPESGVDAAFFLAR